MKFVLFAVMLLSAMGVHAEFRKHVLVLQSYNGHLSWTRSIGEGIRDGLDDSRWDLWFESLDVKNLGPTVRLSGLDPWFTAKYGARRFDLVITEDDAAYSYFTRTRNTIFHGAPGLAIGLNARPATRLPAVSYILENPDFGRTLDLALELYPQMDTLHVVVDRSETGRQIRAQIEKATLVRPARFDWMDSGSATQIVSRCAQLSPGEALIFVLYFDPAIAYNSYDGILKAVRKASRVPIFAFWDFAMDSGATGGYLYDGRELGRGAARIAQKMVDEWAAPVLLEAPYSRWIFDWNEIQRFKIPLSRLPGAASYLNSPQAFWSIHWVAALTALAILVLLVGFLVAVLVTLRTKHRMIEAGEEIIATQRELMASLGDVIETRSEETASHVQRIMRLSVRLGDLMGISPEQRQQLEIGSSMHDIGKIGIPDDILKNPRKLTQTEMELMRTHTLIGHSIFCSSPNPSFQIAATIALEHHERWDGKGYPNGKRGDEIHLLSRIVSLVDVFDALLTKRLYKEAWDPARVKSFIESESGRAFDPAMAKVFLDHWNEFCQLRETEGRLGVSRRKTDKKRRVKSPRPVPV